MNQIFLKNLLLFANPDIDNETFIYLVAGIEDAYNRANTKGFKAEDKAVIECHQMIIDYLKEKHVFAPHKAMQSMLSQVQLTMNRIHGIEAEGELELTYN